MSPISKIGAIRCQMLRLKCTQFVFRWSYAPDSAVRAYSAPPDPIALLLRIRREIGREGEGKEEGKET